MTSCDEDVHVLTTFLYQVLCLSTLIDQSQGHFNRSIQTDNEVRSRVVQTLIFVDDVKCEINVNAKFVDVLLH